MLKVTKDLIIKMCDDKENLKDFWTIDQITQTVKEWDNYNTKKDLMKVINSLEFLFSDINGYGYLCVLHDIDYDLEFNFHFTDWYDFLMENIDSGGIIDIIYDATDRKDWLFDDSVHYSVLYQHEAEKEAQNEFDYLEKSQILQLALWYAEARKEFNTIRD